MDTIKAFEHAKQAAETNPRLTATLRDYGTAVVLTAKFDGWAYGLIVFDTNDPNTDHTDMKPGDLAELVIKQAHEWNHATD